MTGTQDTLADNLIASGIRDRISYSVGQFHFETDGVRPNNDLEQDLLNLFVQARTTTASSALIDLRHSDEQFGDRELRFDIDNFFPKNRDDREINTARIGGRYTFDPANVLIGSYVASDLSTEDTLPGDEHFLEDRESHGGEGRFIHRSRGLNVDAGAGFLLGDVLIRTF